MLKNNVSWPKNYHLGKYRIKDEKRVKDTDEEKFYKTLKEKHEINMTFLPDWNIEKYIHDLSSVCGTKNAHVTYKKAGWKSSFIKHKNVIYEREKSEDIEVREECERALKMAKPKSRAISKIESQRMLKTEESEAEDNDFDVRR